MLTSARILACGTPHRFALSKAVDDEDRAASKGAVMPEADTSAARQGGSLQSEEGIHTFAQLPRSPAKGSLRIRAVCNQVRKLKVTFLGE